MWQMWPGDNNCLLLIWKIFGNDKQREIFFCLFLNRIYIFIVIIIIVLLPTWSEMNRASLSQGCALPGYDAMINFRPEGVNIREGFWAAESKEV